MIEISGRIKFACPPICDEFILRSFNAMRMDTNAFPNLHKELKIPFPKERNGEIIRVGCVMHPCDWIREVYLHEDLKAMGMIKAPSFSDFILWILQINRGIVGKIFKKYKADTVLRVEDFPWCMMELMDSIGYDESSYQGLRKVPAYNSRSRELPIWDDWMLREFKETEKEIYEQYSYF